MCKKSSNIISVMIIISILLSIVSCNKSNPNEKETREILPESPWYYGEIIDIDLGIDNNRTVESLRQSYAGSDDNNIYIFTDGRYKVDWDKVQSNTDFAIKSISIIDRFTKKTKKIIDLYNILDVTEWPEQVIFYNGQFIVKSESWNSETDTYSKKDFFINVESEKVVDIYDFELDYNLQYWGSYTIGEYRIETICDLRSQNEKFLLRVFSPDGGLKEIELKETGKDIFDIPVILALDENTALIPAAMERDYKFYKLKLADCKIEVANVKDYEWINLEQITSSYSDANGSVFASSSKGITKIDMQNKTMEKVFDYSWCAINRQYLSNLRVADVSEDTFLLCGQYHSSNMFSSIFVNSFVVIEFTRADKNPHAGKKVIELYFPDNELNETIADAIIKYNESNNGYYIEIADRYNKSDYFDSRNINSIDDYDAAQLSASASLSNDLAMDLMNGEGPDILLNTSDLGQLNNDNYLVDLAPYVTYLESDKYFTNIIDGAKTDGKLYQLPISFTIEGIQTDPEYAGKTGIGFTTDEYKEFLYGTLNGKDIIESGQALYFIKLFNGMSDRFIVNGKVDLTCSEFENIAGYVRDNVKQDSLSWDIIADENMESMDVTTKGNKTAYYCNCPGISGYLVKRAQIHNGTAILGIPSSDGCGPMFGTDISVAVSAYAVNIEACVEFVKQLLSDDVQNELVMSDKFVLNKDAFKMGCNAAIEYFNTEEGSQNIFDYAAGTYVTSHMKFTRDDIDNLENIIMSCSKIDSADSAINAILLEEMPAYFLGQKELDSVVTIIQDRAQKVLDERN